MTPIVSEQVENVSSIMSSIDSIDSTSSMTTTGNPTTNVSSCQCGDVAVKFCQGCDLVYCDTCCMKRHRKGAFQRHTIVVIEKKNHLSSFCSLEENMPLSYQKNSICEECIERNAILWCKVCELRFCIKCSKELHQVGTMQSHVDDGHFQFLHDDENTKSKQGHFHTKKNLGRHPMEENIQTKEEIRVGETTEENPLEQEELLFSSSSQSFNENFSSNSKTNDSYNLWGGWKGGAFGDTSASMDNSASWTSLTGSLSMDSTKSSSVLVENDLSLQSITKSLRSLSFAASGSSDDIFLQETPDLFSRRSSSFSGNYSSPLRSSWQQCHHFDASSTSGTSTDNDNEEEYNSLNLNLMKSSITVELYQQFCSNFASRHVVIKSFSSRFDTIRIQQIHDNLNNFGSIAVKRDEFSSEGLLFFTFFELKAALSAVKLWHTITVEEEYAQDRINFCAPYEIPNEINSATLLVMMKESPPIGTHEMRQFCSRFGEVASVLQEDIHSSQYIVEYNDARDLSNAINELNGSFYAGGSINATRTHPPTLEMAKIQLFQDALENFSFVSPVLLSDALSRKGRSKSLSSSATSLVTSSTSPSSSSSSSINASFLESGGPNSRASSPFSMGAVYNSPLFTNLNTSNSHEIWASTGNSCFSSSNTLSSPLGTAGGSYSSTPSYQLHQQSYHHSQGYHLQQSHSHPHVHPQSSGHLLQQRGYVAQNKYVRSGSDSGFMRNNAPGGSNGNGQNFNGRNDQGTGEFSLCIERVTAGEDKRTTLMIRNIPNKYTQQMLLAEINQNHHGHYDFFYLPIDFKNKCNMGYAFINFMESTDIVSFYQEFNDQKWTNFNSEKVCAISYARLQGKQAMILRFQNSSLLEKHESYRPLVFVSNGPNRGQPETFPSPNQKIFGQPIKKNPLHHNNLHHIHAMNASDEYYMGSPGRHIQMVGGHHGNFSLYEQQQHLYALNNIHSIPPPPSNNERHYLPPPHTSVYSNGMM